MKMIINLNQQEIIRKVSRIQIQSLLDLSLGNPKQHLGFLEQLGFGLKSNPDYYVIIIDEIKAWEYLMNTPNHLLEHVRVDDRDSMFKHILFNCFDRKDLNVQYLFTILFTHENIRKATLMNLN